MRYGPVTVTTGAAVIFHACIMPNTMIAPLSSPPDIEPAPAAAAGPETHGVAHHVADGDRHQAHFESGDRDDGEIEHGAQNGGDQSGDAGPDEGAPVSRRGRLVGQLFGARLADLLAVDV